MIIDTHCHLNFKAFWDDVDEIISRMRAQDVRAIVVGSQFTTSERAVRLAAKYPNTLRAAVALHPLHLFTRHISSDEVELPFTTRQESFDAQAYESLAHNPHVVAIGECGLDYYSRPDGVTDADYKKMQKDIFRAQIALAQTLHLPIIVHTRAHPDNYRDAQEDALAILEDAGRPQAVWHAFATHPDTAKKIIKAGYMVSFTGLIANPAYKEILRAVVRMTPFEQMMIETDAPYMALSGTAEKRNTPLAVLEVAQIVADYKEEDVAHVQALTTQNAINFFNIKEWPAHN